MMDLASGVSEQTGDLRDAMRRVDVVDLIVPDHGRRHSEADVAAMADSIALIGIQTPPSIDRGNNVIAGVLRVLAARRIGLTAIHCFVVDDANTQRRWGISENLHRANLSALERSAALVQWAEVKGVQVDQVSAGGRGRQGGVAHAARTLRIGRSALRRASTIASIPAESRAAIRKAGLDDNQSALLAIAATPVEQQLDKINEYLANGPSAPTSRAEIRFQALMRAWENADRSERERFITEVVAPYTAASQSAATA